MKIRAAAFAACGLLVSGSRRSPTREATRRRRSNSGSTWHSVGCGARPSTAGKKAVELDPTYAQAYNDLAIAYEHEGQLDKARKAYEKPSSSRPTTPRFGRTTSSSRKSMIERAPAKTTGRLALAAAAALPGRHHARLRRELSRIPIETPIQPKLDISAFQRVLVAGFVAGGSEDIDANQETVRLLRSQLRTKSALKVIDADILPLIEVAQDQAKATAEDLARENSSPNSTSSGQDPQPSMALPQKIKDEKDLSRTNGCSRTPPTGNASAKNSRTRSSSPARCSSPTGRPRASCSATRKSTTPYGRRRVVPTRTYMERKGFMLRPKFVFIDGRSGRDDVLGELPRRGALQRAAEHRRRSRPISS
jgi:hypothetical protein